MSRVDEIIAHLRNSPRNHNLTAEDVEELYRAIQGGRPSQGAIHRSVRNYLVNEIKLGEARVVEIVREIAGDRVRRWLDSQVTLGGGEFRVSAWLHRLVTAAVQDAVREAVKTRLAGMQITVAAAVPDR